MPPCSRSKLRAISLRAPSSGSRPGTASRRRRARAGRRLPASCAPCARTSSRCSRKNRATRASSSRNDGRPWRRSAGSRCRRRRAAGRPGQEHRQRPAAGAAGQELVRRLVDAVDVRPLLTVDLDVHEQLVHECRPWPRPRRTRGPSRGTSGRRNSPPRASIGLSCSRARARASSLHGCQSTGLSRVLQQVRAGLAGEAVRLVHSGTIAHARGPH